MILERFSFIQVVGSEMPRKASGRISFATGRNVLSAQAVSPINVPEPHDSIVDMMVSTPRVSESHPSIAIRASRILFSGIYRYGMNIILARSSPARARCTTEITSLGDENLFSFESS